MVNLASQEPISECHWLPMRMKRRIARGEGSYLYDTTGHRYQDGSGSPAALSIGHGNPEVNAAIASQLAQVVPSGGDAYAATSDVRGLLARSRPPPIRGYTPSAPRYGLPCVGCLKQMPNAMFQQSDGPLQGAELSNPHYRDGHLQIK